MFLKKCAVAAAAALVSISAGAAAPAFTVNGETVTSAEQETLIRQYTDRGQARTPQLESQIRWILARDKVLLQLARKDKLAQRDDVQRMIDNATKNILMSTVVNDWLAKNPVKEEDVKALFEAEKKRWGNTEVRVRHILVKDEKTANNLMRRIRKGEDFGKLASENSLDTQQNKLDGGLIEWNSPNMFDKEFAECFKDLKPGQMAKKPVKTHLGWHVVRLEGKRKAVRFSNYEADAPALRQLLTQQRAQAFTTELVKKADIKDISSKAKKNK